MAETNKAAGAAPGADADKETNKAAGAAPRADGSNAKLAGKVDLLAAAKKAGLKTIKAENVDGVADGTELYVYSAKDTVSFKFAKTNKHMPEEIGKVNIMDAAVMQMQGKGEIVKG